ncbi:MAG: glycosyltransferase [Rhodobacteraceae bacterium]|jgi:hypothetical protein|nr:glycosyltransferase [Paracoccaceae bacterium]
MDRIVCDLGIFAHQEETTIATILADLVTQSAMSDPLIDLRIIVVANGCTDATVSVAEAFRDSQPSTIGQRIEVVDLPRGGKSRAFNAFVQEISRPDADTLVFCDADIRMVRADVLSRMLTGLRDAPQQEVFVSRPVKDVNHFDLPVGLVARLIASGGDGLADWRTAICGQLYAMRAATARGISLPIGLPVEDGFVRAMVLTDLLTRPEDLRRIDGDPDVFHVYESIRTPGDLVRHQARIVTGSAVNEVVFRHMRRVAPDLEGARRLLATAAAVDGWLEATLRAELPRAPHGYVPFHFLFWRLTAARGRPWWRPRTLAVTLAGLALDSVAWVQASLRLWRGRAAGHW